MPCMSHFNSAISSPARGRDHHRGCVLSSRGLADSSDIRNGASSLFVKPSHSFRRFWDFKAYSNSISSQRAAVTHFLMCGRPDLPYGFVCFSVKAQVSSEGIFETQGHFPLHIVSSFSLSAFALLQLVTGFSLHTQRPSVSVCTQTNGWECAD